MPATASHASCTTHPARLLAAGFGCRRGCSVEELWRLLADSLQVIGLNGAELQAIASLDTKLDEPGLQALAERLELPLQGFSAPQLQVYEPRLSSLSDASRRATGCAGVAEACALAAAEALGAAPATLLIRKQRSANATFALACASLLSESEPS